MNLQSLARKNVKHHLRNYLAYFLSSTFAVILFFLYASLLVHPMFRNGEVPGQARVLMNLVELIVALFSILFISYSHSSFLKVRKKELALFTMLGMLPKQIAKIIRTENLLIGSASMVLGILIGTVFSKLFFLAVAQVLSLTTPIDFVFSWPATLATVVFFGLLFLLISGRTLKVLRTVSVAELFRDTAKPKEAPRFSVWLVLLSLLSMAGGYYLALTSHLGNLIMVMFPILLLVVLGTYLLFTQSSVAILRSLLKNPNIYYKHVNLISISQMSYKIKDNARILFMVTILCSMVLTAVGFFATQYAELERTAVAQNPFSVSIVTKPGQVPAEDVHRVLAEQGLTVQNEAQMDVLTVRVAPNDMQGSVLSATNFNALLAQTREETPVLVQPGQAMVIYSVEGANMTYSGSEITIRFGDRQETLPVQSSRSVRVFNEHDGLRQLVVVDDATYGKFAASYGQASSLEIQGYRLENWRESAPAVEQLQAEFDLPQQAINSQIAVYDIFRQMLMPLLFLSVFIGLLFFLASGSMLYFKQFTELDEDRKQFHVLLKLGIGVGEIKKILATQIRVLFFVPFVVALVHASFAIKMAGSLVGGPVWQHLIVVGLIYFVLLFLYYGVTKRSYLRAVIEERIT